MVTRIGRKQFRRLFIKEWMDAKDVSDEKAANRIGVARETIYRWRMEQHRLNPEKVAQLAAALDIDPADFHRLPSQPSLDALVRDKPQEIQDMAFGAVERLVGKAS